MSERKNIRAKALTAIVCDEIRMESNGKPFLIGIYVGSVDVGVPEIPTDADSIYNFRMSVWMPIEVKEKGTLNVEVQIKAPGVKDAIIIKASVNVDRIPMVGEMIPLPIGPIPLKLWQSGQIEIQFRNQSDSDWETVRTLPVNIKVGMEAVPTPVFP